MEYLFKLNNSSTAPEKIKKRRYKLHSLPSSPFTAGTRNGVDEDECRLQRQAYAQTSPSSVYFAGKLCGFSQFQEPLPSRRTCLSGK